jgi:hypothetical protein
MNEVTRPTGRHTPEDICKIMGGLTRAQAMEILASKGLREGEPYSYEIFHQKQVQSNESEFLHPPLKSYYFLEPILKDVSTAWAGLMRANQPELMKLASIEWRPKQYFFSRWVHLYWSRDHGRQVSCGYRQTYSWFEWELKGEVNN